MCASRRNQFPCPIARQTGPLKVTNVAHSKLQQAQKEGAHATVFGTDGQRYTGEWHNNQRHGRGVVVYQNGDKYEGDWRDGLRHGQGTLWVRGPDGRFSVRYGGDWADDLPGGQGVFFDGSGNSYEGGWRAGRREGLGRAVYSGRPGDGFGGDVYEGMWSGDLRNGHGTMTFANGDEYVGEWRDDLKHGAGSFTYTARGRRYDGVWEAGVPRCGAYCEVRPAPPGAPGSLPCVQLAAPDGVLQRAADGVAAAGAGAAAVASGGVAS
ncbi:MORN repeat-containing protein [Raphidocelis subcapitata]|uniref:MORN repeat-containing protein 3 n=1 Tax=Raphidocelis subcapitata TaxID=307507 RepID=A0A2V0NSM4_9CHLO|nr:MORN repeat-containing protein [Raphidocelis subcapitata]|eukprot:GBF87927.1 MORN repeat-containing protein [Raphidocelis subcapitata]